MCVLVSVSAIGICFCYWYCHFFFQITGIRAGPLAHHGMGRVEVSGLFSLNGLARPGLFSTGQNGLG